MTGRVGDLLATSTKPASRKADESPVHAKASGIRPALGSTG